MGFERLPQESEQIKELENPATSLLIRDFKLLEVYVDHVWLESSYRRRKGFHH